MKHTLGESTLELVQGDITESNTDAIVNAANAQLQLGAGVAGAIRSKGGPRIQEECDGIGQCPVGNAVVTSAGHLNARFVIHAVGPRQGEGSEPEKLQSATLESLRRAEEKGMHSLTFPAISTGIFGFPVEACARIMLGTVLDHIKNPTPLRLIRFCLYDSTTYDVFQKELERLTGDNG